MYVAAVRMTEMRGTIPVHASLIGILNELSGAMLCY